MKNIDPIQIIDSLAEITRHRDRGAIEQNLLKTLTESDPSSDFWLYKVLLTEPELSLGLAAHASGNNIVTLESIRKHKLPDYLRQGIINAVESGEVVVVTERPNSRDKKVLYPSYDSNGNIFAVLVQSAEQTSLESQRLIHGFLRIYSSYLELIDVTKRDKLTGLLNRETLGSEISSILLRNNSVDDSMVLSKSLVEDDKRQNKGELKYWLGLLDVDFFKAINDNYGHLYGDEILILLARFMEESVRDHDLVFRYGGEEFVIILRAFNHEDALAGFDRIRARVSNHNYAKIDKVTISIGVRQILYQLNSSLVISEADAALYYAKEHGRDQIQFYQQLVDEGEIETEKDSYEAGDVDFF